MKRFILSPEAKDDLVGIKSYLVKKAGIRVARYVIREVRSGIQFVAGSPGSGHTREDLTSDPVRFWPVFSYLIVYNPAKRPVEVVRVLHGFRDVAAILDENSL